MLPQTATHLDELVLVPTQIIRDRRVATLGEELDSGKGGDAVFTRDRSVLLIVRVHLRYDAVLLGFESSCDFLVCGFHALIVSTLLYENHDARPQVPCNDHTGRSAEFYQ